MAQLCLNGLVAAVIMVDIEIVVSAVLTVVAAVVLEVVEAVTVSIVSVVIVYVALVVLIFTSAFNFLKISGTLEQKRDVFETFLVKTSLFETEVSFRDRNTHSARPSFTALVIWYMRELVGM